MFYKVGSAFKSVTWRCALETMGRDKFSGKEGGQTKKMFLKIRIDCPVPRRQEEQGTSAEKGEAGFTQVWSPCFQLQNQPYCPFPPTSPSAHTALSNPQISLEFSLWTFVGRSQRWAPRGGGSITFSHALLLGQGRTLTVHTLQVHVQAGWAVPHQCLEAADSSLIQFHCWHVHLRTDPELVTRNARMQAGISPQKAIQCWRFNKLFY